MAGMLENKVAIVTGGSGGIGRATAIRFAAEGAKVVIGDIDVEGGAKVVEEIKAAGGEVAFVEADCSVKADIERLVQTAVDTYGRLDVAVNNAGVGSFADLTNETDEGFEKVMNLNVWGVYWLMQAEVREMMKNGEDGGHVVNVASVSGVIASNRKFAYVASKHAVCGMTKSAAIDYGDYNIRVNAVLPGPTLTALTERTRKASPEVAEKLLKSIALGRYGKPEEQAETALYLATCGFTTGHCLVCDGARSVQ